MLPIRCSGRSEKGIKVSTNQAFIEFQTRAIFIFEQSQVGCARSEPRPGSSPLCAIRATVVSIRHSPLLTGSTLLTLLSPLSLLSFSLPPLWPLGFRLTTLLSRAFRRKPTPREDTEFRYVYTRTVLSFSIVLKRTRRHLGKRAPIHHEYQGKQRGRRRGEGDGERQGFRGREVWDQRNQEASRGELSCFFSLSIRFLEISYPRYEFTRLYVSIYTHVHTKARTTRRFTPRFRATLLGHGIIYDFTGSSHSESKVDRNF